MYNKNISRRQFIGGTVGGLGVLSMDVRSLSEYFIRWHPFDSHIHLPSLSGETYAWHNVIPSSPDSKGFFDYLKRCGIEKILGQGSPDVPRDSNVVELVTSANDASLHWRDKYPDFVIPTCSAIPNFLDVSLREMERMRKEGAAWLGEFTGYMHGYKYNSR